MQRNQLTAMWRTKIYFIFNVLLCVLPISTTQYVTDRCHMSKALSDEIDSYAPLVHKIINETTEGSFKGITWQDLATFVDKFGPRFAGTPALEEAINYVLNESTSLGFENVHGEPVTIPHWVRYVNAKYTREKLILCNIRKENIIVIMNS